MPVYSTLTPADAKLHSLRVAVNRMAKARQALTTATNQRDLEIAIADFHAAADAVINVAKQRSK